MTEEDFFVRFFNIEGNQIMELTGESPGHLLRKMIKNSEAISSLRSDHHTTNFKKKFEEAKE